MKRLLVLLVAAYGAIGLLAGCMAQDGIQGPPGKDGTDGKDGANAVTSCLKCHTDSNFNQKTLEYNFSKHYLGTTSARNSRFCVRCHTNEGFQEITWDDKPWGRAEIPNSTRIACQTCHKMTGFDFPSDTVNAILRKTDPVILNYLNQFDLVDWKTKQTRDFAQGTSKVNNLCATCHQIRGSTSFEYSVTDSLGKVTTKPFAQMAYFPLGTAILPGDTATEAKGNLKKPTDSVAYMAGRSFSVHDGNQTNLFYGTYGYDFGNPITLEKRHHAKDDCTVCHMNEWDPVDTTGGHSLRVNLKEKACVACHNLEDTIVTTQTNIKAMLTELGDLMVARKMAKKTTNATTGVVSYSFLNTHDFNGKLYSKNLADSAVLYASLVSANKVDTATSVVKYINMMVQTKDADIKSRIGRKWLYGELGAAYNFGFINSELSFGIHNDEYARKLLQASIDWLKAHP